MCKIKAHLMTRISVKKGASCTVRQFIYCACIAWILLRGTHKEILRRKSDCKDPEIRFLSNLTKKYFKLCCAVIAS